MKMTKIDIIPKGYEHWVMLFWTATSIAAMARATTLLEAMGNVAFGTGVILVILFFRAYLLWTEKEGNPFDKINDRLDRIEKKLE